MYFRHLKFYQYVFGTRVELDLRPSYSIAQHVEMRWFQPLSAATYQDGEASSTIEEGESEGEAVVEGEEGTAEVAAEAEEVVEVTPTFKLPALPQLEALSGDDKAAFQDALNGELLKIQQVRPLSRCLSLPFCFSFASALSHNCIFS
jgi:hypothetical protein